MLQVCSFFLIGGTSRSLTLTSLVLPAFYFSKLHQTSMLTLTIIFRFWIKGWWSGGFGYGLWIGILVASGFSVIPVPSILWKNQFELFGGRSTKVGLILTLHTRTSSSHSYLMQWSWLTIIVLIIICLLNFLFDLLSLQNPRNWVEEKIYVEDP